jgi:predicted NAD/FAD-binding protein
MPYPDSYQDIAAHEDSIQKARAVKEQLGLTWSDFLERGALELDANR